MKDTAKFEMVFKAQNGTKFDRAEISADGQTITVHCFNECPETNTSNSPQNFEEMFPIVEASKLSLKDNFMKYKPQTKEQKRLKKSLEQSIKEGLKDFRRPIMDPSVDEDGKITFKAGNTPAVGKNCYWWEENAKAFMPEKDSRLGSLKEYDAFLGTLIKYLVNEKNWSVENAWKAVCDDSKKLGHYWNSENAKYTFEPTGSRPVGKWNDLANTYKIVGNSDTGFSVCGGNYGNYSINCPLADVSTDYSPSSSRNYSVGWLVLSV